MGNNDLGGDDQHGYINGIILSLGNYLLGPIAVMALGVILLSPIKGAYKRGKIPFTEPYARICNCELGDSGIYACEVSKWMYDPGERPEFPDYKNLEIIKRFF